jgi:hypothetical protein
MLPGVIIREVIMEEFGWSWEDELAKVAQLAEEAEREHMAIAVDGDATSVAIVQSARTAGLLVRLLQGVRQPTEGDRRILLTKADRLRALMGSRPS